MMAPNFGKEGLRFDWRNNNVQRVIDSHRLAGEQTLGPRQEQFEVVDR